MEARNFKKNYELNSPCWPWDRGTFREARTHLEADFEFRATPGPVRFLPGNANDHECLPLARPTATREKLQLHCGGIDDP